MTAVPHIAPGIRLRWIAFLWLSVFGLHEFTWAQGEDAPGPRSHSEEIVRFGQDAVVGTDESVSRVVLVHGSLTVDGDILEDVVVVGGSVKVSGKVRGNVVVVFGDIEASPTAVLRRPVVVIGGKITAQPGAKLRPSSQNFVLNKENFPMFTALLNWVTQGAFYLRPLPPRVAWSWYVPLGFLMIYALMSLMVPRSTAQCVEVLASRPLTAYAVGLLGALATLLCLPFLLLFSAVGIGFLLLLGLAMLVLYGRMVVIRFIGYQVANQLGSAFLQRPLVSLLVGSVLLCATYMIPVIGLGVWVGLFPLALGAVMLAGFEAIRPNRSISFNPAPIPPQASPTPASAQIPAPPQLTWAAAGRPAGFFIRTLASLIDLVVVVCLTRLFDLGGRGFLLVWLGYQVAFWSWSGSTLGARVFGLVLRELDGRPVHFQVALVRVLASFLSALPLFLGFFWAAWDIRKQSWHDKLAGTVMVWRQPRTAPPGDPRPL